MLIFYIRLCKYLKSANEFISRAHQKLRMICKIWTSTHYLIYMQMTSWDAAFFNDKRKNILFFLRKIMTAENNVWLNGVYVILELRWQLWHIFSSSLREWLFSCGSPLTYAWNRAFGSDWDSRGFHTVSHLYPFSDQLRSMILRSAVHCNYCFISLVPVEIKIPDQSSMRLVNADRKLKNFCSVCIIRL